MKKIISKKEIFFDTFIQTNIRCMNLLVKKREIKEEIDRIDDEKLVWAIARLLHLDEDMDVPEWHKQILEERIEKYETGNAKMKDWDEVQKNL